jgi:leader peptidase (prepilin peptidase)/N-methyltransferase
VAITFIDLESMKIPDVITYPAIPVCMGLSLFMGHPRLWDGLVGGVAGYLVIVVVAEGYRLITRRDGMGYGDAKLLAMIGGLMGWRVLLPVLFLASLQGSVIGISYLMIARAIQKKKEGPLRHAKLPFGPFISLAAVEVLLLGDLLRVFFPYFYVGSWAA